MSTLLTIGYSAIGLACMISSPLLATRIWKLNPKPTGQYLWAPLTLSAVLFLAGTIHLTTAYAGHPLSIGKYFHAFIVCPTILWVLIAASTINEGPKTGNAISFILVSILAAITLI